MVYRLPIQVGEKLEFLLFFSIFYEIRFPKTGIISIHYRSIGKGCSVKGYYSMLQMYMPEKMQSGLDFCYSAEEFFRTIIYIIVKIQNTEWRCMGNENVRLIGDISIMFGLTVSNAVAHKHRDTIKLHSINFYSGIA